jgi:hypothetical protein
MANNPYTFLPVDVCGDIVLPDFPVNQDCISYDQLRSEVCGLIIVPNSIESPVNSIPGFRPRRFSEWDAIFDNTTPDAVHYMVGKGSFLQTQVAQIDLAGGRVIANAERGYRLDFSVLNMDNGHKAFGLKLQRNYKAFSFWLHTLGNRVIGGDPGLFPFYTDADFPFAVGAQSREQMRVIIDTEFLNMPEW